jgi:hypothetical protein
MIQELVVNGLRVGRQVEPLTTTTTTVDEHCDVSDGEDDGDFRQRRFGGDLTANELNEIDDGDDRTSEHSRSTSSMTADSSTADLSVLFFE